MNKSFSTEFLNLLSLAKRKFTNYITRHQNQLANNKILQVEAVSGTFCIKCLNNNISFDNCSFFTTNFEYAICSGNIANYGLFFRMLDELLLTD